MKWTAVKHRLPKKLNKNYQCIALSSKTYNDGNYIGQYIPTIVQDWVIREYSHNFIFWQPLEKQPYSEKTK